MRGLRHSTHVMMYADIAMWQMAVRSPSLPLLSQVVAHEAKGPIGVVLFSVKPTIVHNVLEGIVHQASSTASILTLHTFTSLQAWQ